MNSIHKCTIAESLSKLKWVSAEYKSYVTLEINFLVLEMNYINSKTLKLSTK